MDNFRDIKRKLISIRMTKSEHAHLSNLAQQSYLNLSDYIRNRLFEDNNIFPATGHETNSSKYNCQPEVEMMKMLVRMYLMLKEVSRNTLDEDKYKNVMSLATSTLKDWGYE